MDKRILDIILKYKFDQKNKWINKNSYKTERD